MVTPARSDHRKMTFAVPDPARRGAPLPADEDARLQALRHYDLLGGDPEPGLSNLVRLLSDLCDTSAAAVTIVDIDRQLFKASIGVHLTHIPRDLSLCAWAILEPTGTFVVPDATADERFRDNELVTGPMGLRAYAAVPLLSREQQPLGALCLIDTRPRAFTPWHLTALHQVGDHVSSYLALRRFLLESNPATSHGPPPTRYAPDSQPTRRRPSPSRLVPGSWRRPLTPPPAPIEH